MDMSISGLYRVDCNVFDNFDSVRVAGREEQGGWDWEWVDEERNGFVILQPCVGDSFAAQHMHDDRKWYVDQVYTYLHEWVGQVDSILGTG